MEDLSRLHRTMGHFVLLDPQDFTKSCRLVRFFRTRRTYDRQHSRLQLSLRLQSRSFLHQSHTRSVQLPQLRLPLLPSLLASLPPSQTAFLAL